MGERGHSTRYGIGGLSMGNPQRDKRRERESYTSPSYIDASGAIGAAAFVASSDSSASYTDCSAGSFDCSGF